MLRLTHALLLIFAAVLLAACQDVPSAPVARTDAALDRAVAAGKPDTLSRYGCYLSSPNPERPGWWRYEQGPLRFPAAAVRKDTARLRYSFRRRAQDGSLVQVANCIIPRTGKAVGMMNRWLKVSPHARSRDNGQEGDAVLLTELTCEWNAQGICVFKPLVVEAELPSEEETNTGGGGMTYTPPTGGTGDTYGGCTSCDYGSPSLSCTSVTRGATATCQVSTTAPGGVSAGAWRFVPADSRLGLSIPGPSSGLAWSGPVVAGGRVEVTVTSGGTTQTLTHPLTVTPRGWRWSASDWQFAQGAAPGVCSVGVPSAGATILGWNTHRHACVRGRILPTPTTQPDSGYTVTSVPGGGPNAGLWYVASAHYYMDRGSNLNPYVQGGGQLLRVSDPAQAQACVNAGVNPLAVTWYTFNHRCMGVNMPGLVTALWAHEGFGSHGSNGHESWGRSLASQPAYDPRATLELLVAASEAELRNIASNSLVNLDEKLSVDAANHGVVRGNYPTAVRLWMYDAGAQSFFLSEPINI